jgi:hypothetical protein
MKNPISICIFALILALGTAQAASAHCDTMDGPVVKDAFAAFQKNNVNYILKWVKADDEDEIKSVFIQAMRVRPLNNSAKELAEKYLIENLVRLHRAGEGVPYEGVKPSGRPIDKAILAADRSIERGNIGHLVFIITIILSGIFLIAAAVFAMLYFRTKKKTAL